MQFRDKEHFEEELAKSVDAMQEELEKAAPNTGSGSNDASGKTPQRKAWAKKASHLESEVDRLTGMASGKSEDHPVHSTLSRAQKELDDHYDAHPG